MESPCVCNPKVMPSKRASVWFFIGIFFFPSQKHQVSSLSIFNECINSHVTGDQDLCVHVCVCLCVTETGNMEDICVLTSLHIKLLILKSSTSDVCAALMQRKKIITCDPYFHPAMIDKLLCCNRNGEEFWKSILNPPSALRSILIVTLYSNRICLCDQNTFVSFGR